MSEGGRDVSRRGVDSMKRIGSSGNVTSVFRPCYEERERGKRGKGTVGTCVSGTIEYIHHSLETRRGKGKKDERSEKREGKGKKEGKKEWEEMK